MQISWPTCQRGSLVADVSFLLHLLGWRVWKKTSAMHQNSLCWALIVVTLLYLHCSDWIPMWYFMLCGVTYSNNRGITVKECTGHSRLKSQSPNMSWGMRFEECHPRLWMAVGSKWVLAHGSGLFSLTRQPSERLKTSVAGNPTGYFTCLGLLIKCM